MGAACQVRPAGRDARDRWPAPVEYSAAVDRYLAQAALGAASRRIYRISLASWAWPLVGRRTPPGTHRRRAAPPIVPLTLLDDPAAGPRIRAAVADRAAAADARTVNRELSALRGAVAWWQDQDWIRADPTAGLRHLARPAPAQPPVSREQAGLLFRRATCLRDHALWRVLYDSGAPAAAVLRLDIGSLDLPRHRARVTTPGPPAWITWSPAATELLGWLAAGRTAGPVFLTGRRAPAGTPRADRCPVTGRGRLSYRRAAEILTEATRPLDPAGAG
ncbi:MAG: site-specific recombinase, partial [Streptosporangiales bacterium]